MNQWRTLYVALLMGFGLVVAACGESGEGPIVPPPPAPPEYADKHMPADWWADAAKMEEGRKLFIGKRIRTSIAPAATAKTASPSRLARAISATVSA